MNAANKCQRQRDGRTSFRPAGELIQTNAYEVAPIDGKGSDKIAKAFVQQHHYSGSYPAARERIGLYRVRGDMRDMAQELRGLRDAGDNAKAARLDAAVPRELVGVAVFSHPASEAVLAPLPCDRLEGVELGRFVLLDDVPGNGESWFLARSLEILKARGYRALLSHSDPLPRRTNAGELVLPGHVGIIYQATNAVYAGRSGSELHVLKPDGTILSPRSMTKIRRWERGAQGAVDELVEIGATPPTAADLATRDARRAWMWREIFATCRRMPHAGNHRYLWAIDKKLRRDVAKLATGEAYPKKLDEVA